MRITGSRKIERRVMPLLQRIAESVRHRGGLVPTVRAVWQLGYEQGMLALWRRFQRMRQRPSASDPSALPDSALDVSQPSTSSQATRLADVGQRPAAWAQQPPGVLLVGHPFLISGRGEDIRTVAKALAVSSIPFHIRNTFDCGEENRSKLDTFGYFDRVSRDRRYRANLFALNADEMVPARHHLGEALFAGGYNIGFWAWELSHFPDAWLSALDLVDEVWVHSRFIQQAVAEKTDRPVLRMSPAVEPSASELPRTYFGLPARAFLFLFFFDFSSFIARKNPWAVIEAFERAFPDAQRDGVGLVIKLNGTHLRPDDYQAFLQQEAVRRPGVWLIDRVLSDPEIHALMKCCDAFVSLHRSEGFGRGPAEAMYFGKPVIVTGYSGNLDFCNDLNACMVEHSLIKVRQGEYPHGSGQLWADADRDHASWHMRKLVADPAYGKAIGARGSETIRAFNSPGAAGRRYAARLGALGLI